jgi:hypothetical protein
VPAGRSIGVIAPLGPRYGKVEIRIDGVKITTVDLRRSDGRARTVIFAKSWAVAGSHQLVVRNLDAGGRPVAIDGFVYLP